MKYIYISLLFTFIVSLSACQNDFLVEPMGGAMNVDSIFSSSLKADGAIAQAYSESLISGLVPNGWDSKGINGQGLYGLDAGTLSTLSGEIADTKFSWQDEWVVCRSGLNANGPFEDSFDYNWTAIRQDYLVMENINKVSDMLESEKEQVKAEMKALIAYRYEEMFKRYGGVPIVKSSLTVEDSIMIPRATLQQTLDFIVNLCDSAALYLPDNYPPQWVGRATKIVALSIKAEALMYAARPLFNSANPYLSLGVHNNLICFENADPTRWQQAATACQAVLDEALANGYHIINTGHPLDDYGTAVATPSNAEIIWAYKDDYTSAEGYQGTFNNWYDPRGQTGGCNGMSFNQISEYYKADGTDQTWAGTVSSPYSDYASKMQEMEPRYKASAMAAGIDAWNNPGDVGWSSAVITWGSTWDGTGGNEACGRRVKFWYHAGSRDWFEYPLYRLAEFYLDLAEAYNELGQPTNALNNLNVIRNRAGLPNITETNQSTLRQIIQREWAIEFYEEDHRLFDVKHWKLADIGNGIIGGNIKSFQFTYVNGQWGAIPSDYIAYSTQVVYQGYWSPNQYLDPFPYYEVNKGYLIQNPGY
jgi:hypothetical protein